MSWLTRMLGLEEKPLPQRLPQRGEIWTFYPRDRSPWPPAENSFHVRILDVKEGWVRYDMGGQTFRDERMEVECFINIYKPHVY